MIFVIRPLFFVFSFIHGFKNGLICIGSFQLLDLLLILALLLFSNANCFIKIRQRNFFFYFSFQCISLIWLLGYKKFVLRFTWRIRAIPIFHNYALAWWRCHICLKQLFFWRWLCFYNDLLISATCCFLLFGIQLWLLQISVRSLLVEVSWAVKWFIWCPALNRGELSIL